MTRPRASFGGNNQEIIHILIVGQSNAAGTSKIGTDVNAVNPAEDNTLSPYGNLMLSGGILNGDRNSAASSYIATGSVTNRAEMVSLVPAREMITSDPSTPATQFVTQSIGRPLADWLSWQTGKTFIISNVAVPGYQYSQIKQGTNPYRYSLAQIDQAKRLAEQRGYIYKFGCIVALHGEGDQSFGNVSAAYPNGYASRLVEWQANYETDIRALIGDNAIYKADKTIPFFICQQMFEFSTSWSLSTANGNNRYPTANNNPRGLSNQGIFAIQKSGFSLGLQPNPKRVFIVGTEYQLPTSDAVHLTPFSYREIAEQFAKAVKTVLLDNQNYIHFQPKNVYFSDVNGNTTGGVRSQYISVEFDNTDCNITYPIVFDTNSIFSPLAYNFGFTYIDFPSGATTLAGSPANSSASISSISSLEPTNNTKLLLTLSGVPSGTAINPHLRYGFDNGTYTGATGTMFNINGYRGAIRDSYVNPSRFGYNNHNRLLSFCWFLT